MLPAFRSNKSILGFCALLAATLVLPQLLYHLGLPQREESYKAMPIRGAGFPAAQARTIFVDPKDADIVLLGSSIVRSAVSATQLEQAVHASTGRSVHVVVLALSFQGFDQDYQLLQDYLARHKAPALVLWSMPRPVRASLTSPHCNSFFWWHQGDNDNVMAGLPIRDRLAILGEMILGAPRLALAKYRPNRLGAHEGGDPQTGDRTGYMDSRFIEDALDPPTHDPSSLLLSRDQVYIDRSNEELDSYQLHFALKVVQLLHERGSSIVFLAHIPSGDDYGTRIIPEMAWWPGLLNVPAPVLGISADDAFGRVSRERYRHFFRDVHMNQNGQRLFTSAIAPTILEIYANRNPHN